MNRVIKDIDIPRINFSYQLVDNSGDVLQEAEVKLKDMSFLSGSSNFYKSDRLRYEKAMLQRWFKKEFQEYIAKKEAEDANVS